MKKIKNIKSVIFRILTSVLVVVLLVCLPIVKLKSGTDLENIYSVFLGNKSKYQGIIEIWNIDTFEAGNKSKTSLLSEISKEYQKQNKGVYFMVRNLTESECLNQLQNGEMPDLFSCSYGVAEKFESFVQEFENIDTSAFDTGAKEAGTIDSKTMAVPWCKGGYFFISTKDKLERAKIENADSVKLSTIALSSGYVVNGKKEDKIIYSLSFGSSKYLMPKQALKTYNISEENLISKNSYNREMKNWSGYSAYLEFIADKSVILLGTQRDVFRMKNRETQGKVSDLIIEQVFGFNDLIQFMLMSKNLSGDKLFEVNNFVKFLTQKEAQNMVSKSGLFSILRASENDENLGAMQNIIPQNFSDYIAPKIFIKENEIKTLQNF